MKNVILTIIAGFALAAPLRAEDTITLDADDFDISSMTTGWNGYARKNASIGDTTLKLVTSMEDGQPVTTEYAKGFGAQATSDYTIQLGGEGVSFSVTVGRDYGSYEKDWNTGENSRKLKFQILDENDVVLAESSEMTRFSVAETFTIALTGRQSIRLHIDPADDGTDWDWGDWVNPTLVMNNVAASAVTVNGNTVASDSLHTSFTSATVTKGVFAFKAGAEFSGEVSIGANGAIAVDVTGKVTSESLNDTIDLFSTPTLTLAEGDSLEKAVFLTGPVVGYTIASRTDNNTTVVYATISDVANIASTRKVTVFTAGYDTTANHWNNEGNWSAGAPVQNSFDVGVFCEDASVNYMTGYVNSHGDFVVRGATVTVLGSNSPNLDMLRFAGQGTVIVQNASVDLRSGCSFAVDSGVTITLVNGTVAVGTGDSVSFDGTLVIGSGATLKVYGYEDEELGVGSELTLASRVAYADGVEAASLAIVGHDDAVAALASAEGGALVARVTQIRGETVYWTGGAKASWGEASNWDAAIVPNSTQTAVFTNSATVLLGANYAVSNVVIGSGCAVTFRCDENGGEWGANRQLCFYEISGAGKARLSHVRLVAANANGESKVSVPELEICAAHKYNSDGSVAGEIDSGLGLNQGNPLHVCSDIAGAGLLSCEGTCLFSGGNSNYTGSVTMKMNGEGYGEKRFVTPESGFSSAALCTIEGRFHIDFAEGVITFGAVDWNENWGKGVYMPYDTRNVTIQIGGGSIHDDHKSCGYGVFMRAEGVSSVEGALSGCANLTVRKIDVGQTLSCGLVGSCTIDVAEGHVAFTGENENGDNRAVAVVVRSGASIGSAVDATIGSVQFEAGAKVLQTYGSAMPLLTATGAYNLNGVLFGVTNPEDMPVVTSQMLSDHVIYPVFAATGTISGKPAAADKYTTAGGVEGGRWMVRMSDGLVCLKAGLGDGLVIIVR